MYDDNEVRAALRGLAEHEHVEPIESDPVISRGRHGLRRRRWAVGGAAVAAVSVLSVGATMLPDLGGQPPAAGGGVAASPRPASPGGSASSASSGPAELITETEALQRCRAQWSRDVGRAIPSAYLVSSVPSGPDRAVRTGSVMWIDNDNIPGFYKCVIPRRGENRPGEVVAPKTPDPRLRAPVDADNTTLLRACSDTLTFLATAPDSELPAPRPMKPMATDLSGWRVVARSSLAKVGTAFVALSPTSDRVAFCNVDAPGATAESALQSQVRLTSPDGKRNPYAGPHLSEHLLESGSRCDSSCTGFVHHASGRLPSKVVRLHAESAHGTSVDIPVKNGYYAVVWANGDPQSRIAVTVTAYDAQGKVVPPEAIPPN